MLLNVKMLTIVGILTFNSMINVMLSWVTGKKVLWPQDQLYYYSCRQVYYNSKAYAGKVSNVMIEPYCTQRGKLKPLVKSVPENFLFSQPKHMLWILKKNVWDGSFKHPKHMLKLMGKKIFTILRSNFCWSKPMLKHSLEDSLEEFWLSWVKCG